MSKPMPKPFKLCYVRHNILYFTDNFEKQWGDDWDDAPYEHNAEGPYEYEDGWPEYMNEHRGHIRYIWYMPKSCDLREAYLHHQDISVEEINEGIVPWLTNGWNGKQGLYAGATLEEAGKWLTVAGALWGELKPMNEINPKPEYWVLSLSGGKDSTALGLEWLARHKADPVTYPLSLDMGI